MNGVLSWGGLPLLRLWEDWKTGEKEPWIEGVLMDALTSRRHTHKTQDAREHAAHTVGVNVKLDPEITLKNAFHQTL